MKRKKRKKISPRAFQKNSETLHSHWSIHRDFREKKYRDFSLDTTCLSTAYGMRYNFLCTLVTTPPPAKGDSFQLYVCSAQTFFCFDIRVRVNVLRTSDFVYMRDAP